MKNFSLVAKKILLKDLPHDGVFVDYTMGDGYNALYMAKYVSEGNVVTFANNSDDMDSAYKLFESNFQDNAHIVLDSPLNVEKYVTAFMNGFTLDSIKCNLSDDEVKELIKTTLRLMKKHRRGLVMVDRHNEVLKSYFASMPIDRVSVMTIAMANESSPIMYIIEKIV